MADKNKGVVYGLITFLITLSTAIIALILTICAVANLANKGIDKPNSENSLTKIKELLCILTSVLSICQILFQPDC